MQNNFHGPLQRCFVQVGETEKSLSKAPVRIDRCNDGAGAKTNEANQREKQRGR